MTKEKVIKDLVANTADDIYYIGNNIVMVNFAIYVDKKMPAVEPANKLKNFNVMDAVEKHFDDNILRELSNAIEIDRKVLDDWIKAHPRMRHQDIRSFTIGIKDGSHMRYVSVNAWNLRDQFEYLKDNRIFLSRNSNAWRYRYDDAVYSAPIFSFSDDFVTTKCITLPILPQGEVKADLIAEEADNDQRVWS